MIILLFIDSSILDIFYWLPITNNKDLALFPTYGLHM